MMGSATSVLDLSIRAVGEGYRRGSWTPTDVTAAVLARITTVEPTVHAWALIDADNALAAAERAGQELDSGIDKGPLHGIPVGIKDIFDVAGMPTRCGSAARRDAPAVAHDARSVARLRDAGAVLVGKTVTQEFAAGVISRPARNPWDPDRVPGGSSGGSAAAVAVGACLGAMGSDTGGSIRIPAAACGVVGFKPTFGQIETEGVYPLSWSLDTIGPLARSVDDAWIMWRTLLSDRRESPIVWVHEAGSLRGVRVGVPRAFFFEAVQPDVLYSTVDAVESLRRLGATIQEIDWPFAAAARATAFIINRVETTAVHERVARNHPDHFMLYGADLRLRVAAGRTVSASLYLEAVSAREMIRSSMQDLFEDHTLDALVAPTLPTTAVLAENPAIEGTGLDEEIGAAWTRLTMPFNATGQPVLTVPCGFDRDGLPIGIQIAGAPGRESVLFRIGGALEQDRSTLDRRPTLLLDRTEDSQEAQDGG